MTGTAAELAAEALRMASSEPSRAEQLARRAMASPDSDDASAAEAARAIGLALRERDDLAGSSRWLKRSIAHAHRSSDDRREAEGRVSLALNHALGGRTRAALESLDVAEELSPSVRPIAGGQRALILMRAGRFREALAAYEPAIASARARDAKEEEGKHLNNRALLHCWRGDTDQAERDLVRAARLSAEIDDHFGVAAAGHNLGWVLGRRGDTPAALAAFDRAEGDFRRLDLSPDALFVDRAELLLQARLVAEALAEAERATKELRRKRMYADLAAANVLLSDAQLLAGRADDARRTAMTAARSFRRDGRLAWAALATAAAVRAKVAAASGSPKAALVLEVLASANEIDAAGWSGAGLDLRLMAARLAFARGDVALGAQVLEDARAARHRGPADLRVRAWHAEALARLAEGNRRGAEHALVRGLSVLDRHRASLGATELRAHASAHGEALTGLGLQLAIADGRAAPVLAWAERQRAQSLRLRPVRPPDDPELTTALAALRGAVADVDEALRAGDDPRRALVRQRELEREVNGITRRVEGGGELVEHWGARHLARLRSELGRQQATLVSYIEMEHLLWAVVVDGRRSTLHELGSATEVATAVEGVAFALRRLARPGLPASSSDAARAGLFRDGASLDRLLVEPLGSRLGPGPVVVVPTGVLHGLAWAALPSLRVPALSVVPSAAIWLASLERRSDRAADGVVVVAGPGLAEADAEAAAVAALHQGVRHLTSTESSARAVLDAIDGALLAHLATHGRFRADNPLFSSLRVADGPLMVHDLTQLTTAPSTVILSACDSATSGRMSGDELLGLVAALFSLGTGSVIASVVPVPDAATRRLMEDLHRTLVAGSAPAVALADARARALATRLADDLVAALAFQAHGDAFAPG